VPLPLLPGPLDSGLQQFTLDDDRIFEFDPLQQATVNTGTDTIWMRGHGFSAGEGSRTWPAAARRSAA